MHISGWSPKFQDRNAGLQFPAQIGSGTYIQSESGSSCAARVLTPLQSFWHLFGAGYIVCTKQEAAAGVQAAS